MGKNNSGYAVPITIGVAVVTIVGGSIAGWGKIRSEIQTRIESELHAQQAGEIQTTGHDDARVLARLSEIERRHSAAAKGLADLKVEFERSPVSGSAPYDDSELRKRLDKLEEVSLEFARGLSMLAKGFASSEPLTGMELPCMDLQLGAECTLTLEPRVPVSVFDGGLRITWPDWAEWRTLTVEYSEGRRQETLGLGSEGKSLKHADGEYSIWVVRLVEQDANQRRLKIGIRRNK